jgi:hypothetical protein
VIFKFASSLKGGSQLNIPGSAAAVKILVSSGIIANGTDGVFGSFNTTRLAGLIKTLKPIFASEQKPIKAGLQPSQIATNEFLDPSIHL